MSGNAAPKRAYSFKEGLAMMAAKEIGADPYLAAEAGEDVRSILTALRRAKIAKGQDKAKHIAAAQAELRKLNPKQHGKLINVLHAKVLALQGRGGDTAVAHLEPGEMVIPHRVLTSELAQLIAAETTARGIDPQRLFVGGGSINPATGTEEFGWFGDAVGKVKEWFSDEAPENIIEPITVSATRRVERLSDDGVDVPAGAPLYTSDQMTRAGLRRDAYIERVAPLTDKKIRHAIRLEERANTPRMVREVLDKYRPLKSELTDDDLLRLNSPGKTNAIYNVGGKALKALGPLGTLASAGLATDQIANSDNKVRETFGAVGSALGSFGGGVLGTAAGTLVAPGPGSVVGGVGGSVVGSAAGQKAGYGLYDNSGDVYDALYNLRWQR